MIGLVSSWSGVRSIVRTMTKRIWFRAKRYGWGWVPSTWQGWLIVAIWCALYAGMIATFDLWFHESWVGTLLSVVVGFAWAAVLIYVAYMTGEPPRWSWGKHSHKKGDME